MAKKVLKAECFSNNAQKGNTVVSFAMGITAKEITPGQPKTQTARTVITIQSTDDDMRRALSAYIPGVEYSHTIE